MTPEENKKRYEEIRAEVEKIKARGSESRKWTDEEVIAAIEASTRKGGKNKGKKGKKAWNGKRKRKYSSS